VGCVPSGCASSSRAAPRLLGLRLRGLVAGVVAAAVPAALDAPDPDLAAALDLLAPMRPPGTVAASPSDRRAARAALAMSLPSSVLPELLVLLERYQRLLTGLGGPRRLQISAHERAATATADAGLGLSRLSEVERQPGRGGPCPALEVRDRDPRHLTGRISIDQWCRS
jgi:hypothetical protein